MAEVLELTLLLADEDPQRYERAAVRWHVRFLHETKNVDLRESQAELILLAAIPANRLTASALAELLSRRRGLEQVCEVLVAWAGGKRSVGGGGLAGFSEITQRSWALKRVFPSFTWDTPREKRSVPPAGRFLWINMGFDARTVAEIMADEDTVAGKYEPLSAERAFACVEYEKAADRALHQLRPDSQLAGLEDGR